jgi:hypothetical protein
VKGLSLIILPKRIEERLREESKRVGVPEEELVVEALSKALNEPLDPETRFEVHSRLSEKYMREAEAFLTKGDYTQASEKAWGAAALLVKALAAQCGLVLRSHGELRLVVITLSREWGEDVRRVLWQSAIALHQNLYENWLPPEMVEKNVEDVKKFVNKLRCLIYH